MRNVIILSFFLASFHGLALGQKEIFPVIKHYGGMTDVPYAIDKPDTTLEYKIIVEVGSKIENHDSIYPPFETICRMYNLHVYGGVKPQNLLVEVVIYGDPVSLVLNNEAYKKKFGVTNPNIEILEEMKNAGIKIYACGQSVAAKGIDPVTLNPDVQVVFSRLTTVTTRQLKGYAYLKF